MYLYILYFFHHFYIYYTHYFLTNCFNFCSARTCFVTTLKRSKLLESGKPVEPKTTSVEYHINGERTIQIPGDIRETAHDVLFEENIDEMSLTTMILETILNVC